MTPKRLLQTAIAPALAELATCGIPDTPEARRFLLAIALQESGLRYRRQVVGGVEAGPAVSYWQFEKGGGCRGVLEHKTVADPMAYICGAYDVEASAAGLWEAMRYQDVVAAAAARLLVYTLPAALPENPVSGWGQYLAGWRPGKPRQDDWQTNWNTATEAVMGKGYA
jgi:hypothetical protein